MPANLTPQYQKAEDAYRRAATAEERVNCLEEMLSIIPKHKGTDRLQADLRKRLKETRSEFAEEKSSRKKGPSYKIPRQGAGQVVLVGGPNAGKSRVVQELTNASPDVVMGQYLLFTKAVRVKGCSFAVRSRYGISLTINSSKLVTWTLSSMKRSFIP